MVVFNKSITLFIIVCFISCFSVAQYADLGTGKLKNQIWWFDWNGFSLQNGVTKTFKTSDGLTVQIKFSNVNGQLLAPNIMNTWSGSVLHYLYDFSDTSIKPTLYAMNRGFTYTSNFDVNITATRNGIPQPFTFVAADGEASAIITENTTLTTDGANWRSIDFFRNSSQNSNPLTGCGTKTVTISDTYGGSAGLGQNPVLATDAPNGGIMNISFNLKETTSGGGGMGIALGIIAAVDRGHLPASYGYAYHSINYNVINGCNYNLPFPNLIQDSSIMLGSVPGDAIASDTTHLSTPDPDDDGVTNFPMYDGSGNYSLNISHVNLSGSPAYLSAWFDFNNDGIFENSEIASAIIPNNGSVTTIKWSGIPTVLSTSKLAFRFRISSDQAAMQSPYGFAKDGEVEDYLVKVFGTSNVCGNNWLYNPDQNSGVRIGDLDVTGDQITIEAMFNRTSVSSLLDSVTHGKGEVVSKHTSPVDANYILRADRAQLTTSNGHFVAAGDCNMFLGKTYYIALVYDGKNLKYYRNGFLLKSVPCTGNMVTNNLSTTIGNFAAFPGQYFEATQGYISEVRIWNVARTQVQLQSYMDNPLPNPTSQVGLLAYYTFDDLRNKQGNATWNGTLFGNATIQKSNPTCNSYLVDSCDVIINPVLQKSKDTAICFGQSAFLQTNVSNVIDYSWSPANGLSDTSIASPIAIPTATTVYYITAHATGYGNSIVTLKDSIKITVLQLPQLTVSKDIAICFGKSVTLNTNGAANYNWFPITGLSSSNIPNPIAKPATSSKYFVTGTDAFGCSATDSVSIIINSLPIVSKANDTTICLGGNAPLFASGGLSYNWLPSNSLTNSFIANPIASPSNTTRYKVSVTGANGCIREDSLLITVTAKPTFSVNPQTTSICLGDSITLTAAGGDTYEWLLNGSQNNNSVLFLKPVTSNTYPIKITNKVCNLVDTLKASVTVHLLPKISIIKSNDLDCFNGIATLNAYGGIKYVWSPVTGLSNSFSSNPQVQISQTTKYTVVATSAQGCSSSDTITVNVFNNSGNLYYVPNAFTPNGDGLNDCFGVKSWGVIQSFELSIYNRFGAKIFFTTDASKCWDGYYKSDPQPMGTYVYYIKAKTLCGDIEKKGTIVLIR